MGTEHFPTIQQLLNELNKEIENLPPESRQTIAFYAEKLEKALPKQQRSRVWEGETTYNYSTLNTSMMSGFILCNLNGEIENCNQFASQLLGHPQLVGKSIFDPVWNCVKEDGTPIACLSQHPIALMLKNNNLQDNFSIGYHRPDNILIWLYMNVRLAFQQGKPSGVVIKFLDVTDYRQILAALRKSEAQQRVLINQNSDGILLVDFEEVVHFVNPSAEQILGKQASQLIGEKFGYRVGGEDRTEIEIENRTAEMRVVNIQWEGEPMYLVSLRDITERKHIEQELLASNRELDAYSHTIAHGLKNPLAVVIGFSSLIKQQYHDQVPADVLTFIQRIDESVHDMTNMIDNLLYLAKLRDARHELEPIEVNIVVKKALRRYESQLQHITVSVEPHLPIAMGQETWLEEVFGNFIHNAIKYSGSNNPDPQISIGGEQKDGMVRYWVQDNGIGIAPENQADLFEKFTRHHKAVEGTGLGLSIVRRIITKLGGEVGVESELDKGSTFWFTLPLPEVP